MLSSGRISVHAVVPSDEVTALDAHSRVDVVAYGRIAAVVSRPTKLTEQKTALRHGRIIGKAVERCSSVVPFRLGVEIPSESDIHEVLKLNTQVLSRYLQRFRDHVEMGLKLKVAPSSDFAPSRLPSSLAGIRSFAEKTEDRQESLKSTFNYQTFEGCYLIRRQNIDAFWLAVEALEKELPALPCMGSGPWAYSFCDFVLRPVSCELRGAIQTQ